MSILRQTEVRRFRCQTGVRRGATVVLLLSLVAAAGAGVGAASVGVLLGLHCVVFAVLVSGFRRTAC